MAGEQHWLFTSETTDDKQNKSYIREDKQAYQEVIIPHWDRENAVSLKEGGI